MRLLHVSDLHLGRALGDLSREAEQRGVVAEIIAAARELDVAMTIIAGDVYDAYTPPAWAEDLFFELLDGLAEGGRRAVSVIAGNHDSGLRLAAAEPLARRLGIVLAGDASTPLLGHDSGGGAIRSKPLAHQVLRVEAPRADAPIVIGLLPFLSEARISRARDDAAQELPVDGDGGLARYAAALAAEIAERSSIHEDGAVHLLALHQYVTGGAPTESERRLRIGAISDIDAAAIPAGLDYVALGHLHRPQEIAGSASPAFYAGSPIAYSFSEAGQDKRAVLIDAAPNRRAKITSVPLTSGRPLEVWTIASIDEARERADKSAARAPIVEIRARLGRHITSAEGDALFALPGVTVLHVHDEQSPIVIPEGRPHEIRELRVDELFAELWQRKHGDAPDAATIEELVSATLEVGGASAIDAGEA